MTARTKVAHRKLSAESWCGKSTFLLRMATSFMGKRSNSRKQVTLNLEMRMVSCILEPRFFGYQNS